MLIHFAEHVGRGYVNGCVAEIEEMGATVEQKDELTFSVGVRKRKNYPFVIQFLRQEEQRGGLSFDAGFDDESETN
jgi:hypothetical protein